MTDGKPVFVLVTASTCGHCRAFRENSWNKTKELLGNKVRIVDIELREIESKIPAPYPAGLSRYASWYPTFLLFSNSDYNTGELQHGKIFNGKMEHNTARYVGGKSPTPNVLHDWVVEESRHLGASSSSTVPPSLAGSQSSYGQPYTKGGNNGVCGFQFTGRR